MGRLIKIHAVSPNVGDIGGGMLVNVSGTPEGAAAWAALAAKHPSFADYPASHDFFVSKLDVDALFFIDMFGGADYLDPAAYLANSTTA